MFFCLVVLTKRKKKKNCLELETEKETELMLFLVGGKMEGRKGGREEFRNIEIPSLGRTIVWCKGKREGERIMRCPDLQLT